MLPTPDEGVHLLVIAKAPVPGRVKTRLCPPLDLATAAVLAASALADTLAAVLGTPAAARTLVLDGPPGPWLPRSLGVRPQRGHGLDERIAAAFADAYRLLPRPMLLIGMDTPQVTPELLGDCARQLTAPGTDAVLGLAKDGGWWALGLHRPDEGLLRGVPMSTPETGTTQLGRLRAAGLRVAAVPELTDVDTIDAAHAVAAECPGSRFAAVCRAAARAA